MYYTIYKTTNLINGKYYIGKHQTEDLNDSYIGSGKRLRYAIEKYDEENFFKEILYVFDNEKLMNVAEKILVTPDTETNYNLCPGGQGGFGYINANGLCDKVKAGKLAGKKTKDRYFEDENIKKILNDNLVLGNPKFVKKYHSDENFKDKMKSHFKVGSIAAMSEKSKIKRKKSFENIGHQQGDKNSQFGSFWITNGIENRKLNKDDKIPDGWSKGRKI